MKNKYCSYWYIITCHTKFGNGELVEHLKWENLTAEVRMKWNWYFQYRAALLKVKYPRFYVNSRWGTKEVTDESPEYLLEYARRKKEISLKGKITKCKNAIEKYECEQKLKLIPDYENQRYVNTIKKLKELEEEFFANAILKNKEVNAA